jgi:hypothetical protein
MRIKRPLLSAPAQARSVYPLLLAGGLALAFGAPVGADWRKPGASPEQSKKDQSQCELRARSDADVGRIDPSGPGTRAGASLRGANTMAKENRSFEMCMRERGYEWVDPKAAPKKPENESPQK